MIKPPPESSSATAPPAAEDSHQSGRSDPEGLPSATGTDLAAAIGRELKSLFDGVATEPVPERFQQLLDELERKSGERS